MFVCFGNMTLQRRENEKERERKKPISFRRDRTKSCQGPFDFKLFVVNDDEQILHAYRHGI